MHCDDHGTNSEGGGGDKISTKCCHTMLSRYSCHSARDCLLVPFCLLQDTQIIIMHCTKVWKGTLSLFLIAGGERRGLTLAILV